MSKLLLYIPTVKKGNQFKLTDGTKIKQLYIKAIQVGIKTISDFNIPDIRSVIGPLV